MNPPSAPAPRVVIKSTVLRDSIVGGTCAVGILAVLLFAIAHVSETPKGNTLTGKIVAKHFTPAPEEQISYGKKGLHTKTIDGEYLCEVRVESENRTFEVPVDKFTYQTKEVGDSLTFLKPPSEQR